MICQRVRNARDWRAVTRPYLTIHSSQVGDRAGLPLMQQRVLLQSRRVASSSASNVRNDHFAISVVHRLGLASGGR
jgi:hypothetical protein